MNFSFIPVNLITINATIVQAQCDCDPVEDLDETPGGDSYSLFGTSVSYVDLHFTSDITLNANLTISNCTFAFDPGVDIIVPSGYTLTITGGSVLTAGIDEMWKGIDVQTGIRRTRSNNNKWGKCNSQCRNGSTYSKHDG